MSCKTCSLEGEIEITKGSFRVSDSNDLSDMSDTIAFLDHGSIEIVAKKLAAQVQLGLDFVLSQPLISLNMTLPTIPLTPFEVTFYSQPQIKKANRCRSPVLWHLGR